MKAKKENVMKNKCHHHGDIDTQRQKKNKIRMSNNTHTHES